MVEQFFTCYVPTQELILATVTQWDFDNAKESGLAEWYLKQWENGWKLRCYYSRLDWQHRIQFELYRN